MGYKIEIFTAGCPVCEPTVNLVNRLAKSQDEVTVHNLGAKAELEENKKKIQEYRIQRVPSVVVNGKLLECCDIGITAKDLNKAGLGI